jgi:hypothetical protein
MGIFLFQSQHLLLQFAGLLTLTRKGRQAVVAEDHAIAHHHGERTGG